MKFGHVAFIYSSGHTDRLHLQYFARGEVMKLHFNAVLLLDSLNASAPDDF